MVGVFRRVLKFVVFITLAVVFLSLAEDKKRPYVCFKKHCFVVELAKTDYERARGLMFRRHLDKNRGMLFLYKKEGIYPFWMKNTMIPLDIIWMDKDKRVVFIKNNALPCGENKCIPINLEKKAKYVLEVNANSAAEINIRINDYAQFYNVGISR